MCVPDVRVRAMAQCELPRHGRLQETCAAALLQQLAAASRARCCAARRRTSLPSTYLLHGVAGQHAKHDGHARVDARVEHAAGRGRHDGVIVGGRAPHLGAEAGE